MRVFKPNRLLKAASKSARPFLPPNVCAPAMKVISSSFFAPAISDSRLSAEKAGAVVKNKMIEEKRRRR
jgi:hypothetical protein